VTGARPYLRPAGAVASRPPVPFRGRAVPGPRRSQLMLTACARRSPPRFVPRTWTVRGAVIGSFRAPVHRARRSCRGGAAARREDPTALPPIGEPACDDRHMDALAALPRIRGGRRGHHLANLHFYAGHGAFRARRECQLPPLWACAGDPEETEPCRLRGERSAHPKTKNEGATRWVKRR